MTFDSGVHPTVEPVQAVWTTPIRAPRAGSVALAIVGIIVAGLAGVLVIAYLSTALGAGALLLGLLLALVPLTGVLLAVRWVDRWDPEPRPALVFAFLWGAGVSVVSALLFDLGVQLTISGSAGALERNDFLASVVQAPLVEEVAKGLGILLIFVLVRRHFDGPVDGVVYAATIAAGFAFSENIQYFGVALMEGGITSLGASFVVRGVFSPFAHVMFTICTGIAVGMAARRSTRGGAVGYFLVGLVPAVALHALWNGAFFLLSSETSLVMYYFVVQVPLFLAAIAVVLALRRQEMRITALRLGEYAAAGWFTAAEVAMLGTASGRRQATAWARRQPRLRKRAMAHFIADATRLAFARERMLTARNRAHDRAEETRLLALLGSARAAVLAG